MPENDPIQFVVTMTVKSPTSNPVDIIYYRGEDQVQALGALMTAATMDIVDTEMPESIRTTVVSVRMDVLTVEQRQEQRVSGNTCSTCGATLVNEDCPNYGDGPEHSATGSTEFTYRTTHVSVNDGSTAMLVGYVGNRIVLVDEGAFVWVDPCDVWTEV